MSSAQDAVITCPQESASLLASTDLPPTPNPEICNCLDTTAFACLVNDATAQDPVKVGALTNIACDMLGQAGSSVTCETIGGNGTTGKYGQLAMCSPDIKLSWAFSAFYMLNPVATSCDFAGNATRNEGGQGELGAWSRLREKALILAPNSAEDAKMAADNCLAGKPAVVTPTGSPQATGGSDSGGSNTAATSSSAAPQGSGAKAALSFPPLAAVLVGALGLVAGAVGVVA